MRGLGPTFFTIVLALIIVAPITPGLSATITVVEQNGTTLVSVQGTLRAEDISAFNNKTAPLSKAIVSFASDGGSVVAGIRIGEMIRMKNFVTLVPAYVQCASACALAWLGGGQRFMGAKARIGFHAAYVRSTGQETGVGNAIVGAYLTRIGLPYSAVIYITQAPPSSMTWLSLSEAKAKGIDVSLIDLHRQNEQVATPPSMRPKSVAPLQPIAPQRAVLYEEDFADPAGNRYVGSAIWRTETVSPGPGLAPELAVKANIEIPDRGITMMFSMVRNTDPKLPASHTIDIRFNLPPNFSGGGIANVPGILMKQAEQARGVPLAGIAVKVTDNVFLIGLSSVESDEKRNMQLLKERAWFDIPIVYTNGSRAILAVEKGTPGERAFNDAFTVWGRAGTAAR